MWWADFTHIAGLGDGDVSSSSGHGTEKRRLQLYKRYKRYERYERYKRYVSLPALIAFVSWWDATLYLELRLTRYLISGGASTTKSGSQRLVPNALRGRGRPLEDSFICKFLYENGAQNTKGTKGTKGTNGTNGTNGTKGTEGMSHSPH